MSNDNKKHKKFDDFFVTMSEILKACFSDADIQSLQSEESLDFFLYLMKYNTEKGYASNDEYVYLIKSLSAESTISDTPEISAIADFLIHLLSSNDSCRNSKFHKYIQRPLSELTKYSIDVLGLELNDIVDKEDLTQDNAIDIITICFLAGRHGLFSTKPSSLSSLLPSPQDTVINKLIDKNKQFTVIYGNSNERRSRFMSKYILSQFANISHSINYESYISDDFGEDILPWLGSKYKKRKNQLYPAILNAYLSCSTIQEHYYIIYGIPSPESLTKIIYDCKLLKNVILICDFDIDSIQINENVSYLPFRDLYIMPSPKDVHVFLKKHKITDCDESFSRLLLTVANGNLFLLYTMGLLVKNISKDQKSLDDFKDFLNNLSLQTASETLPGKKYSMPSVDDTGRSGNYLIGHIRKLYGSILTVDEQLLILLVALFYESGLSEKWIKQFLSENAFTTLEILIKKGLIFKQKNTYYYEESLLIPYAFLQVGRVSKEKKEPIFSEVFDFLNSLLKKICYQNYKPIDYSILCTTIKITFHSLFSLLHKLDNNNHFSEIWYYHIKCIGFFLDNGDIKSVQEIKNRFDEMAKKYTKRPGERFRRWKKIYDIYADFLNLRVQSAIVPYNSWMPYTKLIDKLLSQITKYQGKSQIPSDYFKIILSILEANISYQLRLCISGIHSYELSSTDNIENYYKNIEMLKEITVKIFDIPIPSKDKAFLSELETAFNTIIQLSKIYIVFHKHSYIDEFIWSDNPFKGPRYKQFFWFRVNCNLLAEQCRSGYASSDYDKASKATCLQSIIIELYTKLQWVPLDALEDYYYALVFYTLSLSPKNMLHLLSYIDTDLQRYSHIWQSPIALEKLQNLHEDLCTILKNKNFP